MEQSGLLPEGMVRRVRPFPGLKQTLLPCSDQRAVTIIEVLASAVIILLGLAAIFGMNGQSLQILRRAQQGAAASQILQERAEELRTHAWPEVARGSAVASWWNASTDSAADLADAAPTETLTVSPAASPNGTTLSTASYSIERRLGKVNVLRDADLTEERLLLVDLSISWREQHGMAERHLRSIVGRAGLTRSGIFGSAFGRAAHGTEPAYGP